MRTGANAGILTSVIIRKGNLQSIVSDMNAKKMSFYECEAGRSNAGGQFAWNFSCASFTEMNSR